MKTIFFSLIAIMLFSSNSFSQTKESNTVAEKKGWWCRKFTIEVGTSFASISTEVTICMASNGLSPVYTIERSGPSMTGYIKTSELIEKSSGKISSKDIESVIIIKSNPEEIEGIKWCVKPDKNKVVIIDNETFLEVILEETK